MIVNTYYNNCRRSMSAIGDEFSSKKASFPCLQHGLFNARGNSFMLLYPLDGVPFFRAGHAAAWDEERGGMWLHGGYTTFFPYISSDGAGSDYGTTVRLGAKNLVALKKKKKKVHVPCACCVALEEPHWLDEPPAPPHGKLFRRTRSNARSNCLFSVCFVRDS